MNILKQNRVYKGEKRRSNDDFRHQTNTKKNNSSDFKSLSKIIEKLQFMIYKLYEITKFNKLELDSQFQAEIIKIIKMKNEEIQKNVKQRFEDSEKKCLVFQQTFRSNNNNTARFRQNLSSETQNLQSPVVHQNTKQEFQQQYDKQLKVIVADYQFEIRKLTEDQATNKYLHQTQKNKMIKQYEQKIHNLKKQLEQQNHNWINRFDIRDKEFKQQVQIIRLALQQEKKRIEDQLIRDFKNHKHKLEQQRNNAIKNLEKKHKQQMAHKHSQKQKEISQLKNSYQHKIKQIIQKNHQNLQKKERQYEIKIVGLASEKKTQQRLHQTTKTELIRVKQKYLDEIHILRKEKSTYDDNINQMKKQKWELECKISQKQKIIQQNQNEFQVKYAEIHQSYQQQIQDLKNNTKKRLIEIIEFQLQKTQEFGGNMKVLQQKHNLQTELYSQQLEQIKNCYQQRPSKQEDLQIIKELEYKLWKKENQLVMASEQIKWHRLQLENKQETYNKIFSNGYNINEIKFPIDKNQIKHMTKDFKSRKVAKSLLVNKDIKNASGKLIHLMQPTRML